MGPPIYIGGNMNYLPRYLEDNQLQWGHRFTSVETVQQGLEDLEALKASMGPPIYIGVNMLLYAVSHSAWESASMGPPIYIGGNS